MKPVQLRMPLAIVAIVCIAGTANAQEIRYSWLDMSFMSQDVARAGSLTPLPGQVVDVNVTDGSGIRFRGSLGTWRNFYLMVDYGSTDIDLTGAVTNVMGTQPFEDEFDYTTIRGGIGLRFTVFGNTDIFGEITYDSLDLDFGSFAGEDFDMSRQDLGGTLGIRTLLGDHFEFRVHGRRTPVGDANLTTGFFESDTLFGAGFGWELVRGFAIVGDFESGEFSSWSVGFRMDLDED
ncbi:MAG: hypothetical protein ACE5F8_04565 [Woeseiaceae bacterium]